MNKNLIYYNNCIDDGFGFKVYIRDGYRLQKIVVANYYTEMLDSLSAVFDDQLSNYHSRFDTNIGYGKTDEDKEYIEELKKEQDADDCRCKLTRSFRRRLLNEWCYEAPIVK